MSADTRRKPTDRQQSLLRYANTARLRRRMGRFWEIIVSSDRRPSEREGNALIDAGWIVLERDPSQYVEDTRTGERTYDDRAVLTAAGREAIAESASVRDVSGGTK